jgi:hypothetical protein
MIVEVLKPENENYLEQFEVLGVKSKSEMINEALDLLRDMLTEPLILSRWQHQRIEDAKKNWTIEFF